MADQGRASNSQIVFSFLEKSSCGWQWCQVTSICAVCQFFARAPLALAPVAVRVPVGESHWEQQEQQHQLHLGQVGQVGQQSTLKESATGSINNSSAGLIFIFLLNFVTNHFKSWQSKSQLERATNNISKSWPFSKPRDNSTASPYLPACLGSCWSNSHFNTADAVNVSQQQH